MKKIHLIALVFSTLFVSVQTFAQYLSFDKVTYDYGIIKENSVNTQAVFMCTNRGDAPIIIKKIVPSSPDIVCNITRDTLEAGLRASISVSLDPKNLKSMFKEYIDVYTTDKMLGKITLTLVGTVKNIDPIVEQLYPQVFDLVRLSTSGISYGNINYPATVSDTIVMYNPQDTAITILFPNVPNYLTVRMYPETIQPNSTALVVVSYNSGQRKEWGQFYEKLYFEFQGKKMNYKKRISLSGNVTEDFSNLTKKQLKNAPKIKFQTETFNFDTVKQGAPVACKFHFTNEGKSTLEIRKIKTSCGCTAGSMEKMSYVKGEEGDVDVTLNTRNKHGNVRQIITIISNDPVNTETKVYIEGVVVSE